MNQAKRTGSMPERVLVFGALQALAAAGVLENAEAEAWRREVAPEAEGEDRKVDETARQDDAKGIYPSRHAAPFRGVSFERSVGVGMKVGPGAFLTSVELYGDGIVVCGYSTNVEQPFRDVSVASRALSAGQTSVLGTQQRWTFAFTPGVSAVERSITVVIDGFAIEVALHEGGKHGT